MHLKVKLMNEIEAWIHQLQTNPDTKEQIEHYVIQEGKTAQTVPFPENLHDKIQQALRKRGVSALYTHQGEAFQSAMNGQSFTAITPTASGKSYCYHLPVLQAILEEEQSRALYLFPTKALAQDQLADLHELIEGIDAPIMSYTFDGDTPPGLRTKVRKAGHIVLTNPDMLHSGILPHHTKWVSLFENLKYIVIDELHMYKGVFGSHVAHVMRRLLRIARYYGSSPLIICTSATIANPKELAENLTGLPMKIIDNNGAPAGRKHFIFYNPPIVHPTFGIRKSAVLEVEQLARSLYEAKIQTIIFARSRVRVEMLTTYLQQLTAKKLQDQTIMGYRGGYLPSERRQIEKGLREGTIQTVISTNALELGIDIGQLDACIMTGYPGNISSALQQAGRAGRRGKDALILYVAGAMALDQYVAKHPKYLLEKQPEHVRIHPDNLLILMDHLKCASFELPFSFTEQYGEFEVQELLALLEEQGVLVRTQLKWHWMTDQFPAKDISLRSASQENVVIIDQSEKTKTKVIGEMDTFSALTLLHEEAIYLHQGKQFQVEILDWEEKKAYVKRVDVDYFTDANLAVELKMLAADQEKAQGPGTAYYGDVAVVAMPTIFKKIAFNRKQDNIGSGPIHLPEQSLHTSSTWFSFEAKAEWSEEQLTEVMTHLAYTFHSLIPLLVNCDRSDIHVVPKVKATETERPTFFVYDAYPGGIGLSEHVFSNWQLLFSMALEQLTVCGCSIGCPACIGAQDVESSTVKQQVIEWLEQMQ